MKNLLVFTLLSYTLSSQVQYPKFVTNQTWMNGGWVNQYRSNYSTDKNGYLLEYMEEVWTPTATAWRPSGRTTYSNNASGLEIQSFGQHWDLSNKSWVTSYTVQTTYNAKNKISTNMKWSSSSGPFPAYEEISYFYDTKGFLTSRETKRINNSGVLTLTSKATYTNNNSGYPVKAMFTNFQVVPAVEEMIITYSYFSGDNVSEMIVQVKNSSGVWVNDYRYTSGYDQFGFLILQEDFDWNGSDWAPSTRLLVTNFPDGKTDFWINEMYAGNGGWQQWQKVTYDWTGTGATGISELENEVLKAAIYFDLNGHQVEKQKNVLLIEQRGNVRRKVIIQD